MIGCRKGATLLELALVTLTETKTRVRFTICP